MLRQLRCPQNPESCAPQPPFQSAGIVQTRQVLYVVIPAAAVLAEQPALEKPRLWETAVVALTACCSMCQAPMEGLTVAAPADFQQPLAPSTHRPERTATLSDFPAFRNNRCRSFCVTARERLSCSLSLLSSEWLRVTGVLTHLHRAPGQSPRWCTPGAIHSCCTC